MSSALADIGETIGIPPSCLEELIQLPVVAKAITYASEHPNLAPNGVWKAVGRSTVYRDSSGLDLESLEVELAKRLEVATRSDGKIIEQRLGHPMVMGRLQRAEQIARRRLAIIEETLRVLDQPKDYMAMQRVKALLSDEVQKASEP